MDTVACPVGVRSNRGFHCILNYEIVLKKRKTISNEVCKEIEINKLKSGILITSVFLVSR